jgi:hypothetical protein
MEAQRTIDDGLQLLLLQLLELLHLLLGLERLIGRVGR